MRKNVKPIQIFPHYSHEVSHSYFVKLIIQTVYSVIYKIKRDGFITLNTTCTCALFKDKKEHLSE